jgi:NTP pyrophosphatase (non-canonical NTP hydrolase)
MKLNELAKQIHEANKEKGFYDTPRETGTLLMLVTSELAEALEADRKNHYTHDVDFAWMLSSTDHSHLMQEHFPEKIKNTFEDEMADAIIRLLDMCAYKGIDIDQHIEWKLAYNAERPYKHGKKY